MLGLRNPEINTQTRLPPQIPRFFTARGRAEARSAALSAGRGRRACAGRERQLLTTQLREQEAKACVMWVAGLEPRRWPRVLPGPREPAVGTAAGTAALSDALKHNRLLFLKTEGGDRGRQEERAAPKSHPHSTRGREEP